MSILAVILLFISAILHTTWNLLLKQAGEKYMANWWAALAGSSVFVPALLITGFPVREVWPLLLVSVLMEVGYYAVLSAAYTEADFSLVYPMARGGAAGLIALWSVLFLGEKLSPGGLLGLGLILAGLLVIAGSTLLQSGRERLQLRGILLALLLAVIISVYSTIDGAAVKRTAALPYTVSLFFLMPVASTPLMLKRYGWKRLKSEWLGHRVRLATIGLLSVGAYFLALVAYSISLISYAGAVREVSVVLGALTGWVFLKEGLGSWRVAGSAILFIGIVLVAVWS